MSETSVEYRCKNPARRELLRASGALNGIDYLEVAGDQKTLTLYFVHDLPGGGGADPVPSDPGAALTKDRVFIDGGVRVRHIKVLSVGASGKRLTVTVDTPGDFSTYTLLLATSAKDRAPPDGFDPRLSEIEFSFKVECPNDFDCRTPSVCPGEVMAEPAIDYLAKDYASFRRLVLDRMSVLMPDWHERSPADLHVALIELLAYVGDHLSYCQDAVATEAYLGTARRRVSVRRHARLLDYRVHEGSNARAWVCVTVSAGVPPAGLNLPAKTRIVTRSDSERPTLTPEEFEALVAAGRVTVFETLHAVTLRPAHNEIRFYAWGDGECCLPRGATHATLQYSLSAPLSLAEGDVLVFEEVKDPATGNATDADPLHRHAVRLTQIKARDPVDNPLTDPLTGTPIVEVAWGAADALPFPLCLSTLVRSDGGTRVIADVSVARANVVLADHGRTVIEPPVPAAATHTRYRPYLARAPLTHTLPFDAAAAAAAAMAGDPRDARPQVALLDADGTWSARDDLLASDQFAQDFVVETDSDGIAYLRFGDNVFGRRPPAGSVFSATYRVGNGRAGNVGAEALARVVHDDARIVGVRNPLAARGGHEPEALEQVRQFAPQAFRTQERAVTAADYAAMAQRHGEVQRAAATFRWTGSWHTAFVTVDRTGGAAVDAGFETDMRAHLERYRMAGYDLEIDSPVFVPLDIVLNVCIEPRYFRSDVRRALLTVFSSYALTDGTRGFFHPDNFSFAQPLYLSEIVAAAMEVEGVSFVEVTRLQRWGKAANRELENGVLSAGRLEVIRVDNDPNFPENGRIDFITSGGL